jgi:hypothetical protein
MNYFRQSQFFTGPAGSPRKGLFFCPNPKCKLKLATPNIEQASTVFGDVFCKHHLRTHGCLMRPLRIFKKAVRTATRKRKSGNGSHKAGGWKRCPLARRATSYAKNEKKTYQTEPGTSFRSSVVGRRNCLALPRGATRDDFRLLARLRIGVCRSLVGWRCRQLRLVRFPGDDPWALWVRNCASVTNQSLSYGIECPARSSS